MEVKSEADVCSSGKAVLEFWASWSEPSKHMCTVLGELAKEYPSIRFQQVEAEQVDDVTIKFNVSSVPTFVFLQDGAVVETLEGADAPGLTQRVSAFASQAKTTTAPAPAAAAAAAAGADAGPGGADVAGRIKYILSSHPVVLFMKGTSEAPRCGFSGRVVEALKRVQAPVYAVDILADDAIRQGVKAYSDWPTYPQLYVKGELVGGCDIILEMEGSGELKQLLTEKLGAGYEKAAAPAPSASSVPSAPAAAPAPAAAAPPAAAAAAGPESKEQVQERIKSLLGSSPVMLFMKGVPDAPRCGFSSKVVKALNHFDIKFGSFDILTDEAVRQGLKEYSSWPTYPQLYVKGELMGGCDIVLEMEASGELKSTVEEMMYRMESTD